MAKFVKFVGSRVPKMRVHIVIDKVQVSSRGYVAGNGTILQLSDAEANVLLGSTLPEVDDDGNIVTGFYVDGNLGEAGLTGEGWEEVPDPSILANAENGETPSPATASPITLTDIGNKLTALTEASVALGGAVNALVAQSTPTPTSTPTQANNRRSVRMAEHDRPVEVA